MRLRTAIALAALLPAATGAQRQAPSAPKPPKPPKPPKAVALFASDTALRLTIVGDWRALGGDRDTLKPVLRPGTLWYVDSAGRTVRLAIKLATRGHYRLKRESCSFPPLRVVFDSAGTKRTVFAGQKALKLGTHCNGSDVYEQYVLREHLAYRLHNLVTDQSFRSRLARVRYVDSRDSTKVVERWARFAESEDDLEDRLGGKVTTARGALYDHIDSSSVALLGLWEYFIGNTDFSVAALHNVRLVTTPDAVLAVPYDFDFSGLVDARYATPDPRLSIRSVRQRLYRGPCLSESTLAALLPRFVHARGAADALYASLPALDRGYARSAREYLDAFFAEARDPGRFAKALRQRCGAGA